MAQQDQKLRDNKIATGEQKTTKYEETEKNSEASEEKWMIGRYCVRRVKSGDETEVEWVRRVCMTACKKECVVAVVKIRELHDQKGKNTLSVPGNPIWQD